MKVKTISIIVIIISCVYACKNAKDVKGHYQFKDDDVNHILVLDDKGNFKITINYCQGLDNVTGKYIVVDDKIELNVMKKSVEGYDGAELKKYNLEILSKDELKFLDCIGCNPCKGDIFKKVK